MELKNIFGDGALTFEQFTEKTKGMKLVDLSDGEYVAKGKYDGDTQRLRNELKDAKDTIATLEANKGDTAALQAEIDKYKAADEKREKEAQEAREKAEMDSRFKAVLGDKEFSSEYAESGVMAAFVKAIADPANKGKGDGELFANLTKDKDGIFKAKAAYVDMGGVNGAGNASRSGAANTRAAEIAKNYHKNLYGETK